MSLLETKGLIDRAKRILATAKEALDGAAEVRKRTRLSVEAATICGRLLIEEQKALAKEAGGKGNWDVYFEATFGKQLPRSTAYLWMKMARRERIESSEEQPPKPEQSPIRLSQTPSEEPKANPNLIRHGMLSLGLFPAKIHEPSPLSGHALPTPKLSTHLSIINRFSAWHAQFMSDNHGTLTQEQRLQLRLDFAPMRALLDELTA